MSRWFRHYAGMMRDEKLVRVAVKASQPIERVIWVWGALLESASEVNDGGRYDFDADEAAYFLRCDGSDVVSILAHLEGSSRIVQGVVAKWGDRQFDSDTSRERQRRYRERRNRDVTIRESDSDNSGSDVPVTSRDGGVTLQEAETETDISSLRSEGARKAKPKGFRSEAFERFQAAYPKRKGANPWEPAWQKFQHAVRDGVDPETIIGAAGRYASEQQAIGKAGTEFVAQAATWLSQKCWQDYPAEQPVDANNMIAKSDPRWGLLAARFERETGKSLRLADKWPFPEAWLTDANATPKTTADQLAELNPPAFLLRPQTATG